MEKENTIPYGCIEKPAAIGLTLLNSPVIAKMKVAPLLIIFYCSVWHAATATPPIYINYFYENGSPLFWEVQENNSILISLMYDNERNSPNRASGHWNFQVFAKKGSRMKLILQNFHNIYNGRPSNPIRGNPNAYLSVDGKNWEVVGTEKIPENRLSIEFVMPDDSVFVARLEPYRVSDLEKLKSSIKDHPLINISEIGQTVEGRPMEIIQVGYETAPNRILLRARAHPWEPGGNWVIQGLILQLLNSDQEIKKYLESYCVYILPMSNKDGVAHGRTRFNLHGMDLNRKWDSKADRSLAPENAALEKWISQQINLGLRPDLAIDIHNDGEGLLHLSRPNTNLDNYLKNMKLFEEMLRKYSWFTEGSTGTNFRNPGSFGEGLLERYGIDACVYELNGNWIAGLNKKPFGKDWMLLGEQLCEVFYAYFMEKE